MKTMLVPARHFPPAVMLSPRLNDALLYLDNL
jgi:hypothetical protein